MKIATKHFNLNISLCDLPLYSIEKQSKEFGYGLGIDIYKICITFAFTTSKQFENIIENRKKFAK